MYPINFAYTNSTMHLIDTRFNLTNSYSGRANFDKKFVQ